MFSSRTEHTRMHVNIQGDSFGTRPKKMRISQRLFIFYIYKILNIFICKYVTKLYSKSNEQSLRYSHFLGSSIEGITLYFE
jgi:hypothetical protein